MTDLLSIEPPQVLRNSDLVIRELFGLELQQAKSLVLVNHYTHLLHSAKNHYLAFGGAIIIWAIPANPNIGTFLTGESCNVWELARLWAPDGHRRDLLSQAISHAVKWICKAEKPDILISYADPNAGHIGTVYRACSWIFDGQTDESRNFINEQGTRFGRRSFHNGPKMFTHDQIKKKGYRLEHLPGKFRFLKPITKKAKLAVNKRISPPTGGVK